MRKIAVTENMTLDGIMEAPEKWAFAYQNQETAAVNGAGMQASDALLLGRVTYEELASYWPSQPNNPITDYLNTIPKFVVSSTLKKADWSNTTILGENVTEEISKLKQQPGKNIGMIGSGTLVNSLLEHDLVDELQLWVYPITLGSGKKMFKDGLAKTMNLVETKTFSSGVICLSYQLQK
jgi:dihydrofolate reductase